MPTHTRTEVQERWDEITRDPSLQDLPYTVETNARGQILLSPHSRHHSFQQRAVQKELVARLEGGDAYTEVPVATADGVKQPDVAWISEARRAEMEATGDPSPLAPEICVEVLSPANTQAEMKAKRQLYLDAGAEEVWLVDEDGTVRFYADDELDRSTLVPDFPSEVEA